MTLAVTTAFVGSLVLAGCTSALLFIRLFGRQTGLLVQWRVAACTFGLGPLLLSFVLTAWMTLLPGQAPGFYRIAVPLTLLALAVPALGALAPTRRALALLLRRLGRHPLPAARIGLVVWMVAIAISLLVAIGLPLHENDPLEYAASARRIFEAASATGYPFIHATPDDGYYGPWSHPAGFTMLHVWGFLLQDSAVPVGVSRLVGPVHALLTSFAIWALLGGGRRWYATWGAALLVTTPLYLYNAADNQIDPVRVHALFCAVMLACHVGARRGRAVAIGAMAGLAVFAHALGLLAVGIAGLLVLLHSGGTLRNRVVQGALVGVVSLLLVSYRLVDNVLLFGSPVADHGAVPVYAIPGLGWDAYFQMSREIQHATERIVYGLFAGFTRPLVYGLSYWLAGLATLFAIIAAWRVRSSRPLAGQARGLLASTRPANVAFVACMIFAGVVLGGLLVGVDGFIRNIRYPLTIQPLLATFTATWLGLRFDPAVRGGAP